MKEYRTLKVAPEDEDSIMMQAQMLNWKLENRQEIYNETNELVEVQKKQSGLAQMFDAWTDGAIGGPKTEIQNHRSVTHFVTLQFSRETDTPYHNRIVQLEKAIDDNDYEEKAPEKKSSGWYSLFVLGILVFLVSLMAVCGRAVGNISGSLFVIITIACSGVVLSILGLVLAKKSQKNLDKQNEEREAAYNQRQTDRQNKVKQMQAELKELLAQEREWLNARDNPNYKPPKKPKKIEKPVGDLIFQEVGDRKNDVVQAVKEFLNISLEEAKKVVENKGVLVSGASKAQADKIIKLFAQLGAVVVIKKDFYNLVVKGIEQLDDEELVNLIYMDLEEVTGIEFSVWQEFYEKGELIGKTILENVTKEKAKEIITLFENDGLIVKAE